MNPKRQYQEKEEKHDNKCLKILNGRVEMGLVMAMKKAIEFKGNFILNPLSFFLSITALLVLSQDGDDLRGHRRRRPSFWRGLSLSLKGWFSAQLL